MAHHETVQKIRLWSGRKTEGEFALYNEQPVCMKHSEMTVQWLHHCIS